MSEDLLEECEKFSEEVCNLIIQLHLIKIDPFIN